MICDAIAILAKSFVGFKVDALVMESPMSMETPDNKFSFLGALFSNTVTMFISSFNVDVLRESDCFL